MHPFMKYRAYTYTVKVRAGLTVVGAIKMWRPLSVTTNLGYIAITCK
jgi:hypothetical protein